MDIEKAKLIKEMVQTIEQKEKQLFQIDYILEKMYDDDVDITFNFKDIMQETVSEEIKFVGDGRKLLIQLKKIFEVWKGSEEYNLKEL